MLHSSQSASCHVTLKLMSGGNPATPLSQHIQDIFASKTCAHIMGFLDNCQPKQRFRAQASLTFDGGPTIWFCVDWDQRWHISISVPEEVEMDDDLSGCEELMERIFRGLSGLVDRLDGDVNLVNLSMDGDFISTSSDKEDDEVLITLYCPIEMIPEPYRTPDHVVSRAELVEVDRLSPGVDLVTYKSEPGSRALFKYDFRHNDIHRNWHELNYWLRLTSEKHPSIVPFECVVTDGQDVPGYRSNVEAVVGFTTSFFPGMTLQDLQTTPSWLFKRRYLHQLLEVVDYLHLLSGIVHKRVAPRNLLINPATDTLQIFNFSCAGRLGCGGAENMFIFADFEGFGIDLLGVATTVYEIVTGDTQLAEQARLDANISTIVDKEWTKNPFVRLDSKVSHYRDTIQAWLEWRKRPENSFTHYTEAASHLDWPQFWKPEITSLDRHGNKHGKQESSAAWRSALRVLRLKFVEWERPAQNKIPDGFRVLGDGTLIAQTDLE